MPFVLSRQVAFDADLGERFNKAGNVLRGQAKAATPTSGFQERKGISRMEEPRQHETQDSAVVIYETHELADQAVKVLQQAGFEMKNISVIGKGLSTEEHPTGYYSLGTQMKVFGGIGASWGALWGGFLGLLYGAGFFLIPGLGPILAAGPLVAILVGVLEGGVAVGGITALGVALVNIGVPQHRVAQYEAAVKAGQYVVVIHGSGEEIQRAKNAIGQP